MITGELKSKVDQIWDTMWSGGISNPLSVIEQLTYLLFIKRLDELHTLREEQGIKTPDQYFEPPRLFLDDLDGRRSLSSLTPLESRLMEVMLGLDRRGKKNKKKTRLPLYR